MAMKRRERVRKEAIITARCSLGVKEQIEEAAAKLGLDNSDIIRLALREGLGRLPCFNLTC